MFSEYWLDSTEQFCNFQGFHDVDTGYSQYYMLPGLDTLVTDSTEWLSMLRTVLIILQYILRTLEVLNIFPGLRLGGSFEALLAENSFPIAAGFCRILSWPTHIVDQRQGNQCSTSGLLCRPLWHCRISPCHYCFLPCWAWSPRFAEYPAARVFAVAKSYNFLVTFLSLSDYHIVGKKCVLLYYRCASTNHLSLRTTSTFGILWTTLSSLLY